MRKSTVLGLLLSAAIALFLPILSQAGPTDPLPLPALSAQPDGYTVTALSTGIEIAQADNSTHKAQRTAPDPTALLPAPFPACCMSQVDPSDDGNGETPEQTAAIPVSQEPSDPGWSAS